MLTPKVFWNILGIFEFSKNADRQFMMYTCIVSPVSCAALDTRLLLVGENVIELEHDLIALRDTPIVDNVLIELLVLAIQFGRPMRF